MKKFFSYNQFRVHFLTKSLNIFVHLKYLLKDLAASLTFFALNEADFVKSFGHLKHLKSTWCLRCLLSTSFLTDFLLFPAFNFIAVVIVWKLFMKIREIKLANFSVMSMESQVEAQTETRTGQHIWRKCEAAPTNRVNTRLTAQLKFCDKFSEYLTKPNLVLTINQK